MWLMFFRNIVLFFTTYFNFWLSAVCGTGYLTLLFVVKRVVYEEPIDNEAVLQTFPIIIYYFAAITMIHITINQIGLLYIEAEILRTGND